MVLFWGVVELLGRRGLSGGSGLGGEIFEVCSYSWVFVFLLPGSLNCL